MNVRTAMDSVIANGTCSGAAGAAIATNGRFECMDGLGSANGDDAISHACSDNEDGEDGDVSESSLFE